MPTLLELSGLTPPELVQGQSLVPLMTAEIRDGSLNSAYAHGMSWQKRPAYIERVRVEGLDSGDTTADSFAIVWEGWKLIHNTARPPDYPEYELFDHVKDPLNLVDIVDQHPDVVERLRKKIEEWQERAIADRLPPDAETAEGMSAEELEKLRALGYVQ
jgi:arylsulfatase A-like enzyme